MNNRLNWQALQRCAWAALITAGCGGGGGGGSSTTEPPAALPASLAVSAPAQAEPGATLALASDLGEGRSGLSFAWDFGDGGNAALARPTHSYTQPGRYTVTLTVSNSAGQRVSAQAAVQVGRFAMVRDRQCTGAANTGWCWQAPQPDGTQLLDVFFLDQNRGWATAQAGQVWSSQDGGQRWQRLPDVPDGTLSHVVFADARNGWASLLNRKGLLARSRDGGQSWQTVATPAVSFDVGGADGFEHLWVLGPDTVIASFDTANPRTGARGAVAVVSADGGASWRVSALAPDLVLPNGTMWQLGWRIGDSTRPARSTDLGLTRIDVPGLPGHTPVNVAGGLDLWYHSVVNDGIGTRDTLFRSRDGGTTVEQWPVSLPADSGATALGSLTLSAQGTGWSVSNSTVLRTEDGARTWSTVVVPAQAGQSLQPTALDPDSLWALVGGQLQLTEDGGRHWRRLAHPDDSSTDIQLLRDPGAAWRLVTPSGQYRSLDGVQQWWPAPGSQRAETVATNYVGIGFLEPLRGVALDDRGHWHDTSDGGRQWRRRAGTPADCGGGSGPLQFVRGGAAWALVKGCLQRSADGGQTWSQPPRPQAMARLSRLQFLDAQRGWALTAEGDSFVTTDGGEHWAPGDAPAWAGKVVAPGGASWWQFAGAQWQRSTDGGATWQPVVSLASRELGPPYFVDARHGWIVGAEGAVFATADGGQTWQRQATGGSPRLRAVFALDPDTVWIAGARGTVLASATGGR